MPLLFIFAYFVVETLAFWGVSKLIGTGWALIALFVTMFFGMSIALFEVRRLMSRQVVSDGHGALYVKQEGVGKLAGNVGLTLTGGLLLSAPGFVSTLLGLLLIFPPTRSLLRTLLGFGIFRSMENAGVRFYERAHMGQPQESYGSFADPSGAHHEVIDADLDEDELRQWSENLDPDDFNGDK
ncbi:FxsA family protein [uncultured Corynebacterium sp.]|uniref:FxsA family protein n=1 Tax=uncultured Corynebacterium sp. TaxID=159447 RepID=UPI0025D7060C|nr:FxsA family protein [uncultured Corynebacterium sp.]